MRRPIVASLMLALVACGGAPLNTPSPPPSPIIPTATGPSPATPTTPPPTPTPRPLVAIPTPPGLVCGIVEVRDSRVINPADAQIAEECFWQAFQRCDIRGNGTIAVRDSTDETPYMDSTYGPAYFSHYGIGIYTIIAGNAAGACAIRASLYDGPDHRTLTGTGIPWPGTHTDDLTTCTGLAQSADGGLRVIGCQGVITTLDIPHP